MADDYGSKSIGTRDTVKHKNDEYVCRESEKIIVTDTAEGFYSIVKRCIKGVYQHCSECHQHHYLSELYFGYSRRVNLGFDDMTRADLAQKGLAGKCLTY